MPRLRRALGWWPLWTALGITALTVMLTWSAMGQPATDCRPSEILAGCGEPPPIGRVLLVLGIEAVVVFVAVLLVALAVRWFARLVVRSGRWLTRRPAPALDPSRPRSAPWWRGHRRIGAVILTLVIFAAGVGADRMGVFGGPAAAGDFGLIRQAWDLLHSEYVRAPDLDSSAMAHAAIGAMTEAVGDVGHTKFLTPGEAAAENEDLSGTYVGIGLDLDESGTMPVVTVVATGGPAQRAGLLVGDTIEFIDGRSTRGMSDDDLTQALRGPDGTQVMLVVGRAGSTGPVSVSVTRGVIATSAVDWAMVPGTSVAFVQLAIFSDGAADELATALAEVHAAGATGIVLDLRGNPGGKADEAVGVASEFLASGIVVQSRDADGVVRAASVDRPAIDTTSPLVVLIDADSASAAEIVASALQDAGRATLVGETTFGTGTGLAEFRLDDGSLLEIGTAEWLTRNGRSVWRAGVAPDIAVALPDRAEPVAAADLREAGGDSLQSSNDAPLLEAVRLLGRGGS